MSEAIDWNKLIPGLPGEGGEKAEPDKAPSLGPVIEMYRQIYQRLVDDGALPYEAHILTDMFVRPVLDQMARVAMRGGDE